MPAALNPAESASCWRLRYGCIPVAPHNVGRGWWNTWTPPLPGRGTAARLLLRSLRADRFLHRDCCGPLYWGKPGGIPKAGRSCSRRGLPSTDRLGKRSALAYDAPVTRTCAALKEATPQRPRSRSSPGPSDIRGLLEQPFGKPTASGNPPGPGWLRVGLAEPKRLDRGSGSQLAVTCRRPIANPLVLAGQGFAGAVGSQPSPQSQEIWRRKR